jgi:uncharacterized lipoprotein YmbA
MSELGKRCFLGKKNKKSFVNWPPGLNQMPQMRWRKSFLLLLFTKDSLAFSFCLAVMMTGCTSPDPAYYNLQPVPGSVVSLPRMVVEVRRPGLAGYLDRSDIVLKSVDYRLNVNGQLRWGEPLGDMVGRVLAQNISQRLPGSSVFGEAGAISADADTRLEVDVQRFDEDASGRVNLVAEVVIERGQTHHPSASFHVDVAAVPPGPGAAALVGTMSGLLGTLADEIAANMKSVTSPS